MKYRAFTDATIINGDASKDVIEKGTILVDEDGKIKAIGSVGDIIIPTMSILAFTLQGLH